MCRVLVKSEPGRRSRLQKGRNYRLDSKHFASTESRGRNYHSDSKHFASTESGGRNYHSDSKHFASTESGGRNRLLCRVAAAREWQPRPLPHLQNQGWSSPGQPQHRSRPKCQRHYKLGPRPQYIRLLPLPLDLRKPGLTVINPERRQASSPEICHSKPQVHH